MPTTPSQIIRSVVRLFAGIIILVSMAPVRVNAQISELMVPRRVVLNDSLFQSGSTEINQSKLNLLDSIGRILVQNPDLAISIDGYADNSGSPAVNIIISNQRAEFVQRYIVNRFHVDPSRVVSRGQGSANPIADDATPEGRLKNRRVEISVLTPVTKRPVVNSDNTLINGEGHITFLQRDVESKPPWASLFADAYLSQPIFELQKVHTREDSRSVITFSDHTEIKVDENTILIIYGSAGQSTSKAKTNNIELLTGGLLTMLRSLNPENHFTVKTPGAYVRMEKPSNVDIGVNERERSAVSVFQGESKVSAHQAEVSVAAGFGTTVDKGARPDPPRKLPFAPLRAWRDGDTVFKSGETIALRWQTFTALTRIDFSHDSSFSGIEKTILSANSSSVLPMDTGRYFVRLTGFDSTGLKSVPDVSQLHVSEEPPRSAHLAITDPESTEHVVTSPSYTITGNADPGSIVLINGLSVPVTTAGTFSSALDLNEGINSIAISVRDLRGRTASAQRSLIRQTVPLPQGTVGFGLSIIDRVFGYENIGHITLFHLLWDYPRSETRSFGIILSFGGISPDSIGPPNTQQGMNADRAMWMIRGSLRNDLFKKDQVVVSLDADAGPMGWSVGSAPSMPFSERLALTLGGGLSVRWGEPMIYGFGIHYLAVMNDGSRFQISSGNNSHSMFSLDFSISAHP